MRQRAQRRDFGPGPRSRSAPRMSTAAHGRHAAAGPLASPGVRSWAARARAVEGFPGGDGRLRNPQVDAPSRDVDLDDVAVFDKADQAALGGFRRPVADREAGGAPVRCSCSVAPTQVRAGARRSATGACATSGQCLGSTEGFVTTSQPPVPSSWILPCHWPTTARDGRLAQGGLIF
jgi:hypothetical protein